MSGAALPRRLSGCLLAAPALALLAVAFIWPMLTLARMSLNETSETGAMLPALSLATYIKLARDSFTWQLTLDSLSLSAFAATASVLLSYPMALFLFRSRSRFRGLLTIAAIAPLLVSGTARVIGWLAILGDQGLINTALASLGLPTFAIINNLAGVRIGLTESVMPYTVLALIAGFGRLDARLEEAAATLGAGPLRAFWRVTFPLTLPAVSAGWLLAFALSISAFITPHLMGGGRVFVLATEIYDAATQTLDWPAAAALSIYALVLLLVLMAAQTAVTRNLAR
ncbi:putative spermidine/putrescine transport system permease protein [Rhizobiales bacterium GAS191]|nr:putative spermidine/putrescine transport system permease protein [Rhizobiales bacterium GAS191]